MPANAMCVRLVHLLDEAKRKELMIIYGEDLGPIGFSAVDLNKGGKAYRPMADAGKRFDRKGEKENRTQKLEINGAAIFDRIFVKR